ncbi:transcriptional regulator, AraC family [Fibrella aestuarina BUZ 2]|uniref:Transcriptional regulator, AraC family n=1 Tax=Fibrella aestuarina BUZ 2 TaxID=1166018 RepID=I0KDU1_9BACT|nr:helix-turn-helix domain-containing protein [Fibrella aestuarina]CCH02294.1 transcriptional regulator, AraC family [Fibrella aestuarina BUZ 2]
MIPQRIAPSAALRPFVKEWLVLESTDPAAPAQSFSFFADGFPGLVFQQSARAGVLLANKTDTLASLFLYGQPVKPVQITTEGPFRLIVGLLHPQAIGPLLAVRANELTDTCYDLSALPTQGIESLQEQLWHETAAQQVSRLSAYVLQLARTSALGVDPALDYALGRIRITNGLTQLPALQQYLNLSERTFERRFEQYVGISPRLFSRICRFQSALSQLESRHYQKLSDIAFDNGYADQSHFIRSFKEFTGVTPLQFRRHRADARLLSPLGT